MLIFLLYIWFTVLILFGMSDMTGLKIPENMKFCLTVIWIAFCYVSHWFTADYHLFRHFPVLKPVLIEEQRLEMLIVQVIEKSDFSKKVNFQIAEQIELNAFASGRRTIAVSRGMLEKFSDQKIR